MPTILITGANRGLGLEFARLYAADGWSVLAACRTPPGPDDLVAIGGDVTVLPYDALVDGSAEALAAAVGDRPIDVLLLNAGTSTDKMRAVEDLTADHWQETIVTNTFGPLHLAALLESNLQAGEHKKLVAISSLAASMSQYGGPREYAYRISKAALNQVWRNLSIDWKAWGCMCLVLRPGKVRTRMNGFEGDLTVEQSAGGMKQVIDNATPGMSGGFYGYDQQPVPW